MKQRGFSLVELAIVLGAAAALAATVFGGVHMWNSHMDKVRDEADHAGYTRAKAEDSLADNKQLVEAQAEILQLQKDAKAAQLAHDKAVGTLAAQLREAKENGKKAEADVLHGLDGDGGVLRDDVVVIVACPVEAGPDSGQATGGPGRSAGGSVGKTCYRFAADVEKTLVAIAGRADRYGAQIISANALLDEDRRVCNGP